MTIALRYRRVSGVGQEENSSLEKQLERMDEYCELHEYETTQDLLYTEVMTSVETWRERPELNKMLLRTEALAKTEDVVVLVDHPDRLARGLDLVLLVETISYYNARAEFVQQKFEDSDEGKIILHMQSWGSKQEWKRIKKRTHDGVVDRVVKKHKPLGSMPSYGYKWDDPSPKQKNRYVYNDDVIHTDLTGKEWSERSVVEYIFKRAKEGMTLGKIAQSLNDLGIPTRGRQGSTKWGGSRIGEMLANPKYMGMFYSFNRNYTRHGNKYRTTLKPIEDRILMPDGTCPAIVDQETWEVVQSQLDYNKKNSIRNARYPEMALCRNGYARCAYCGGAMNYRTDNRFGTFRYFCIKAGAKKGCSERNTVSTRVVDDVVWRRCCEIIRDPAQLRNAIEALKTPNPVAQKEKPVEIRKKEVEDELNEYIDLLHGAKTDATRKRARGWIKFLEEQLAEIEQEENILQAITHNWKKAEDEIKKFNAWCIAMRENLDNATYSQKRTCVEYLGIRAIIFKIGTPIRIKTTVAPPNILQALAGMEKKGTLTMYSQQCGLRKNIILLTFNEAS